MNWLVMKMKEIPRYSAIIDQPIWQNTQEVQILQTSLLPLKKKFVYNFIIAHPKHVTFLN